MHKSFILNSSEWPELWQATLRLMEETLPAELDRLGRWVRPLKIHSVIPQDSSIQISLEAANDFMVKIVQDAFLADLSRSFTQITGMQTQILFLVSEQELQTTPRFEPPVERPRTAPSSGDPSLVSGTILQADNRSYGQDFIFDPRYSFDSFVVGASNQFAHAAAIAVAEQPGKVYNPLFLYSPPGLGKTHLLHAIGNQVLKHSPQARVAYISAERFVNEFVEAIQHGRMTQFRTKYRDSYDVILIDDIQFIADKDKSEEEFFHTFNALHSTKRQIVLTSDRPPKEIRDIGDRMRTRFEWGLVADISTPEIETRIAILKAKAERDDVYLPDDVATFLATHIKSSVRELEGTLINLKAHASLTGSEISLDMAKSELRTSIPEEGNHVTVEAIQQAVAKHFRIRIPDLRSNSRERKVAFPRQIAMYLIRKYTKIGLKETGTYFGGKDHSTVAHAVEKIEGDLEKDPQLRQDVEAIQNLL